MAFNFKELVEGESFDCIFKGFYKQVGAFKKPVYHFKDSKDRTFHIWGSSVLNHILYGIPFGSEIKLTYKGMYKTNDSKYPLKQFDIEIINPPV